MTLRLTRTFSKIGVITVGPVTETIAPKSKLSSQDQPSIQCASAPAKSGRDEQPDGDKANDGARGVPQLVHIQKKSAFKDHDGDRRAHNHPQAYVQHIRLHQSQEGRAKQQARNQERPG